MSRKPADDDQKLFLNQRQSAKALGVPVSTFQKWEIPPLKREKGQAIYYVPDLFGHFQKKNSGPLDLEQEQARLAQTRRERLELDLQVRRGELVEKKDIEVQAFEVYRIVRDTLMNIPNRCAGEICGGLGLPSNQQDGIYQILNREIHQILVDLTSSAKQEEPVHENINGNRPRPGSGKIGRRNHGRNGKAMAKTEGRN